MTKGLYPECIKNSYKSNKTKKTTKKQFKEWAKDLNIEENIQIASKCMKRWSTSLFISEMQIKTTRNYYTSTRKTKSQKTRNTKYQEGCGAGGTLIRLLMGVNYRKLLSSIY